MNQPTMRDADMPLLDRIDAAIKRVTSGQGQMRVPVEATDPDVVLGDAKAEIERLRADAERYRWLRGGPDVPSYSRRWSRWEVHYWEGNYWQTMFAEYLDAAIDAELEGEK